MKKNHSDLCAKVYSGTSIYLAGLINGLRLFTLMHPPPANKKDLQAKFKADGFKVDSMLCCFLLSFYLGAALV